MPARIAPSLELRIPPLALVITVAFTMWVAGVFTPALNFQFPFQSLLAVLLAIGGFAISFLGVREFNRAKTTVNPTLPTAASSLVTHGIYRHTRNPMYLGFLVMLFGCATARPNLLAFSLLPVFILYLRRFQIEPEERALTTKFGSEFKAYSSAVRRWI